jgi:uncharacterized LabA/DUF88 family protein
MSTPYFAILLDGAFVIKKLQIRLQRFPSAVDIRQLCVRIGELDELRDRKLLRIYFYHAQPAEGILVNPIDKSRLDLAASKTHYEHKNLLRELEMAADFELRLGETVIHDWRLGGQAMRSLKTCPRMIEARDLIPNILQKGVDLRIGLDIARLSLERLAEALVVVTGDSDLVPALRFARREGRRVYLDYLDHAVARDLKAHCDVLIQHTIPRLCA